MLNEPDETDDRIITVLETDARASLRKIAAHAGVTEATAKSRLTRLLDRGVVAIRGIAHPLASPELILVVFYITYDDPTLIDPKHSSFGQVQWLARFTTRPIIVAEYALANVDEVAALADLLGQMPGTSYVRTSFTYRLHSGPGAEGEILSKPGTWKPESHRTLDHLDYAIIGHLGVDGRASYTVLAADVGLSVPATRRRVVGMTDAGLLSFSTFVQRDNSSQHRALLSVAVESRELSSFIEAATRTPGVTYVAEVSAELPIVSELLSSDQDGIVRLVQTIRDLPGVLQSSVDPIEVLFVGRTWGHTAPSTLWRKTLTTNHQQPLSLP